MINKRDVVKLAIATACAIAVLGAIAVSAVQQTTAPGGVVVSTTATPQPDITDSRVSCGLIVQDTATEWPCRLYPDGLRYCRDEEGIPEVGEKACYWPGNRFGCGWYFISRGEGGENLYRLMWVDPETRNRKNGLCPLPGYRH